MIDFKNERAPRKSSLQGARFLPYLFNLTNAPKNSATKPTHSSARLTVARRGDNQMAIAKKICDMLLPTTEGRL